MKGISKKSFPYVVKDEQSLPREEQTTFWIRPAVGDRMAESQAIFERNKLRDERGNEIFDKNLSYRASVETFLHMIEKVENYRFHEDSPNYADGKIYEVVEDPRMLVDLYQGLQQNVLLEIVEVHMKPGLALKRVEEKKVGDYDVASILEGSR